jgi:hypothetical protein
MLPAVTEPRGARMTDLAYSHLAVEQVTLAAAPKPEAGAGGGR